MKTIITTAKAKYHKPNLTLTVIDSLADKMITWGWAVEEGANPDEVNHTQVATDIVPEEHDVEMAAPVVVKASKTKTKNNEKNNASDADTYNSTNVFLQYKGCRPEWGSFV